MYKALADDWRYTPVICDVYILRYINRTLTYISLYISSASIIANATASPSQSCEQWTSCIEIHIPLRVTWRYWCNRNICRVKNKVTLADYVSSIGLHFQQINRSVTFKGEHVTMNNSLIYSHKDHPCAHWWIFNLWWFCLHLGNDPIDHHNV